jgi:hypothetical protein
MPANSGDPDRLAEQPHDERELDHEERVELVHRDAGPVVLQVRHWQRKEGASSCQNSEAAAHGDRRSRATEY